MVEETRFRKSFKICTLLDTISVLRSRAHTALVCTGGSKQSVMSLRGTLILAVVLFCGVSFAVKYVDAIALE